MCFSSRLSLLLPEHKRDEKFHTDARQIRAASGKNGLWMMRDEANQQAREELQA